MVPHIHCNISTAYNRHKLKQTFIFRAQRIYIENSIKTSPSEDLYYKSYSYYTSLRLIEVWKQLKDKLSVLTNRNYLTFLFITICPTKNKLPSQFYDERHHSINWSEPYESQPHKGHLTSKLKSIAVPVLSSLYPFLFII